MSNYVIPTFYLYQGHVEDLPSLLYDRFGHGCGSYRDGDDRVSSSTGVVMVELMLYGFSRILPELGTA